MISSTLGKKFLFFMLLVLSFDKSPAQDTLIIQENELGFCFADGIFKNDLSGWQGTGYIDINSGVGVSISWKIFVQSEGIYTFIWRYAFAGTATNLRDAKLVIDGQVVRDTIHFPYTDTTNGVLKWACWGLSPAINIDLPAGDHEIRLEALYSSGLGNFDYFMVIGNDVSAISCVPRYVVSVRSNNSAWGTVSYSPEMPYYNQETQVTIRAQANPGYFFQCWTGEETSADSVYTFSIKSNVNEVARFLPDGTEMDTSVIGYATVQDDKGTHYMVFGGILGDTVEAQSLGDLQMFLGDTIPRVVKFSGEIIDSTEISVKSDKTLLGVGDTAHLKGIMLSINQARNVIIQNVTVSQVIATGGKDALEINGKSKNIVIDHCEFFSDRDHGEDYYDGLLDIKNESSFITVSWSRFHDHYKVCLISSGDEQVADTVTRVTFHHNYFYNCGSRLPSIRFGRSHIFNNYYKDCNDAINSRMNAWVRVERNYFENVDAAVMTAYSPTVGKVQLIDNHFGSSSVVTSPTCDLQIPYSYQEFLDETDSLPGIIAPSAQTSISSESRRELHEFKLHQNYPNPFNPTTAISYQVSVVSNVSLEVYDILGREVMTIVNEKKEAGYYTETLDGSKPSNGIYFVRFIAQSNEGKSFVQTRKLLLMK